MGSVAQVAVVPIADENRTERGARPLPRGVAADHQLRALRRLDLAPGARALARLLAAVLALADAPFESARHRRSMQRHAVVRGVHELHQRRGKQALCEVAAPLGVGELAQVDAFEVDQVEAVENARLRAVLHRIEGRLAGRVESDDLAVEHHGVHGLHSELGMQAVNAMRSEENTSELQSLAYLV